MSVVDCLFACGVVPVVQLSDPKRAVKLARTLLEAGLPCIEVTFRTAGAPEAIAAIRTQVPEVLVAAGTVVSTTQAQQALDAGAQLVVAPGTDPDVVEYVHSRGAVMLPGVVTPSEVQANLARGLSLMKFFPAEPFGGMAYLTAMAGPFQSVRFVPSGGVSAGNLQAYLALRNVLACGGSWIAPASLVEAADWAAIREATRHAVAIVRALRPAVPFIPSH